MTEILYVQALGASHKPLSGGGVLPSFTDIEERSEVIAYFPFNAILPFGVWKHHGFEFEYPALVHVTEGDERLERTAKGEPWVKRGPLEAFAGDL
jgi:hypothetical protein